MFGPGDNYHKLNSHVMAALIRKFIIAYRKKHKQQLKGTIMQTALSALRGAFSQRAFSRVALQGRHSVNPRSLCSGPNPKPLIINLDGTLPVPCSVLTRILEGPIGKINISEDQKKRLADVSSAYTRQQGVYGKGVGFGVNQSRKVTVSEEENQRNLVLSHSIGFSHNQPRLAEGDVRLILFSRLQAILKGSTYTGVSPEVCNAIVKVLEADALPEAVKRESLTASGDLGPNANVMKGLLGKGNMKNPDSGEYEPADQVLRSLGIDNLHLKNNDGLVLINGVGEAVTKSVHMIQNLEKTLRALHVWLPLSLNALEARHHQFKPDLAQTRDIGESQYIKFKQLEQQFIKNESMTDASKQMLSQLAELMLPETQRY